MRTDYHIRTVQIRKSKAQKELDKMDNIWQTKLGFERKMHTVIPREKNDTLHFASFKAIETMTQKKIQRQGEQ